MEIYTVENESSSFFFGFLFPIFILIQKVFDIRNKCMKIRKNAEMKINSADD